MKQGAVLVDPRDQGLRLRVLVTLDQAIQDGRADRHGHHQIVARQLHFVELFEDGMLRDAGPAPYLDYRPAQRRRARGNRDRGSRSHGSRATSRAG